MNSRTVRPR
ncbi:hypothetical protein D030_3239A, partial [Vibrio parahaemolyticus AQ3810]